jgi:hypothetical protein
MQKITRAQRVALKRIYDRDTCYSVAMRGFYPASVTCNMQYADCFVPLTYRQFRKRVTHSFDCLMLHWCGMWLGIESDGYTHS